MRLLHKARRAISRWLFGAGVFMPQPYVTEEYVIRFATYLRQNPSWGIFHGALADFNYNNVPLEEARHYAEYEMAVYFNRLSPRLREQLGRRAERHAQGATRS